MDERVQVVDPPHEAGESREELLYRQFPDVKLLLDLDQFQSMPPFNVYSAFNQCDGVESATQMIEPFLIVNLTLAMAMAGLPPVDSKPVPCLS